jgi:hypothetical protein
MLRIPPRAVEASGTVFSGRDFYFSFKIKITNFRHLGKNSEDQNVSFLEFSPLKKSCFISLIVRNELRIYLQQILTHHFPYDEPKGKTHSTGQQFLLIVSENVDVCKSNVGSYNSRMGRMGTPSGPNLRLTFVHFRNQKPKISFIIVFTLSKYYHYYTITITHMNLSSECSLNVLVKV